MFPGPMEGCHLCPLMAQGLGQCPTPLVDMFALSALVSQRFLEAEICDSMWSFSTVSFDLGAWREHEFSHLAVVSSVPHLCL